MVSRIIFIASIEFIIELKQTTQWTASSLFIAAFLFSWYLFRFFIIHFVYVHFNAIESHQNYSPTVTKWIEMIASFEPAFSVGIPIITLFEHELITFSVLSLPFVWANTKYYRNVITTCISITFLCCESSRCYLHLSVDANKCWVEQCSAWDARKRKSESGVHIWIRQFKSCRVHFYTKNYLKLSKCLLLDPKLMKRHAKDNAVLLMWKNNW